MEKIQKDKKIARILLLVMVASFILIAILSSTTNSPEELGNNGLTMTLSFVVIFSAIGSLIFFVKSFIDRKNLSSDEKAKILYEKQIKKAEKEDQRRADEEAKRLAMEKVEEERKKRDYKIEEKASLLAREQLKKEELEEIQRLEKEREQEAVAISRDEIKCPKCGSHQISVDKKGYSIGKGVFGTVLLGPIGLMAGGVGKDKIRITCLNCGNTWTAGDFKK